MSRAHDFQVPDRSVSGLVALGRLDEESFGRLLEVLGGSPPLIGRGALGEGAGQALPGLPDSEVQAIVAVLMSVEHARAVHGWELEEVGESLVQAQKAGKLHEEIGDDLTLRESIGKRVVACLNTVSVYATAKIWDLTWANTNTYHAARVISEIRPIFPEPPSTQPLASVVVHMLEVSYYGDDGEIRSLFVALDDYDLKNLTGVIERAKVKASSIEEMLAKFGLTRTSLED